MPKLDVRILELTDGTALRICATWNAIKRVQAATGFDVTDSDQAGRSIVQHLFDSLPKVVHCLIYGPQRDEFTPDQLGDLIEVRDAARVIEELMASINPREQVPAAVAAEGQQNIPFVNGVPEPSVSISNAPMPSGGTT